MSKSWLELWTGMGPLANGIIVVLALMSVVAMTIAVRKLFELGRMARKTRKFAPEFSRALEANDVKQALKLTQEHVGSHVALVSGEVLRTVQPLIEQKNLGLAADAAERAAERAQILLACDLRRGLGALATIGATAPFLGLLGTVIGITNSFNALSQTGGGIESVAAGIGEALITTAVGLVVAIPSVWLYNYFTGRLERLFSELAYASRELGEWILFQRIESGEAVDQGPEVS